MPITYAMLKYNMPLGSGSIRESEHAIDVTTHSTARYGNELRHQLMPQQPFHYRCNSMYSAVGDINYFIAENLVMEDGRRKETQWQNVGLKHLVCLLCNIDSDIKWWAKC